MYSLIDMNILNAATLVRLHPGNLKKVKTACISHNRAYLQTKHFQC